MQIKHIQGDLFNLTNKYVLAHCIAQDVAMGAGIALEFRRRYPEIPLAIKSHRPKYIVPDVALTITKDHRKVYNLITKQKSFLKPRREELNKTLHQLHDMMIDEGDKYLAMPLIGAGLDELDFTETNKSIQEIFSDTDINITIVHYVDSATR